MSDEFMVDFGDSDPTDTSPTPKPGKCHVMVEAVTKKEKSIEIKLTVLAHEVENQRGKKCRTWLSLGGASANRASQFCIATGIVPPDYFVAKKAAGAPKQMALPLPSAVGKTFCTTLNDDGEFNGMPSVKIGFDFTHPLSPKAEDYPRDMNYVQAAPADAEEQALDAALASPAPAAATAAPAPAPVIDDSDVPF